MKRPVRTRNLDRASLFRCIRRLRRHRTDGRTRYVLLGQGLCVPILWSLASPPDRTYTRSPYAPLSKEASVTACHHPTNVHIAGFAFNRTESGAGGDPRRGLTVPMNKRNNRGGGTWGVATLTTLSTCLLIGCRGGFCDK